MPRPPKSSVAAAWHRRLPGTRGVRPPLSHLMSPRRALSLAPSASAASVLRSLCRRRSSSSCCAAWVCLASVGPEGGGGEGDADGGRSDAARIPVYVTRRRPSVGGSRDAVPRHAAPRRAATPPPPPHLRAPSLTATCKPPSKALRRCSLQRGTVVRYAGALAAM